MTDIARINRKYECNWKKHYMGDGLRGAMSYYEYLNLKYRNN